MNRNRFLDEKLGGGNFDIATCIAMKVDTKTIFFSTGKSGIIKSFERIFREEH